MKTLASVGDDGDNGGRNGEDRGDGCGPVYRKCEDSRRPDDRRGGERGDMRGGI